MKCVAFVHAKGNSERVPGKNMKLLGGKPLFTWALESAFYAREVSEVVIDSDDDEILKIGAGLGATPLKRPKHLANNKTTGDDLAYWQASNRPDSDLIAQVIPTSPFIRGESIDRACQNVWGVDSVVGVHEDRFYLWEGGKPAYYKEDGTLPNSFELKPTVYETTGLYVTKTSYILENVKRMNPNSCRPLYLSKLESVDINTMEDFEFAELIATGMGIEKDTLNNVL